MAPCKKLLSFAFLAVLSIKVADAHEDRNEEHSERVEMLAKVGKDMHQHLHGAQEHHRGPQGPSAQLLRNANQHDIGLAGMEQHAGRSAANAAKMREVAEEVDRQHRQHREHMADRSAHSLRDAHAAQSHFAAGGEGRDEITPGKHKAAMREMARNAAQNLHSMGHEHGPAGDFHDRAASKTAEKKARAAARDSHRDALSDEKYKAATKKMADMMHMRP